MSDDGSVLSQAEIDALFRQATGMNIARQAQPSAPAAVAANPAASAAGAAPNAVQTAQRPVSAVPVLRPTAAAQPANSPPAAPAVPPQRIVKVEEAMPVVKAAPALAKAEGIHPDLQAALRDITKRILRLEEAVAEISCRVDDVPSSSGSARSAADISGLSKNLNGVIKRVNAIQQKLENTPDYNLSAEFECSECGSHGHTAVPVICTKCGTEGWWGYWPKEDSQEVEDEEKS